MTKKNGNLSKAKKAKNDEFYTQLPDIVKELKHYRDHFEGKKIYLNCDDPRFSEFWNYFNLNFEFFKLEKLVATHYSDSEKVTKWEKTKDGLVKTPMKTNGDFRSDECIAILEDCDIIVTNPPFSLFREFIGLVNKYEKKFLVIGNKNAITYKECFKLIKNNQMWLGNTSPSEFRQPEEDEPKKLTGLCLWFTNLEHGKRNEDLILYKNYYESNYPKYDNYDIINVDKTKYIPTDYDGVIGVPITFLNHHNPNQFEILGIANSARWIGLKCLTIIDGIKKYNRILIRKIQ